MIGAVTSIASAFLPHWTFRTSPQLVVQIDGRGEISVFSGSGQFVNHGLAVGWAAFGLGIALLVIAIAAVPPIAGILGAHWIRQVSKIAILTLAGGLGGVFACDTLLARSYADFSPVSLREGWWLLGGSALLTITGAVDLLGADPAKGKSPSEDGASAHENPRILCPCSLPSDKLVCSSTGCVPRATNGSESY